MKDSGIVKSLNSNKNVVTRKHYDLVDRLSFHLKVTGPSLNVVGIVHRFY